ncbi:oxoeicosanoid receptor 1 [Emydura macquarii macquarii]|uniref:oxoeicosanoid receptor 1 n=1 Tax=Emydura macquarii macquarii TaxID=1129001 RepID=UPI003529D809
MCAGLQGGAVAGPMGSAKGKKVPAHFTDTWQVFASISTHYPTVGSRHLKNNKSSRFAATSNNMTTDELAPVLVILVLVLAVEIVIGLIGNGIALSIFCSYRNRWTSSTVYLFSLVIADFFLIINLPYRIHYYMKNEVWVFTEMFCHINLFMLSMNRTASIVFLTAIAMDRYFKVVHPHRQLSKISTSCAAKVAIALWLTVILMNSHIFTLDPSQSKNSSCQSYNPHFEQKADMWHILLFFLEFFLPLGIIIFCIFNIILKMKQRKLAKRNKVQRAVKVLVVIVLVYTVCFLPSIVTAVAILVTMKVSPKHTGTVGQLLHASFAFTYLNSVLDPVLYCFSSPVFLNRCKKVLCKAGWFKTSVTEETNQSLSRCSEQRMKTFQPSTEQRAAELCLACPD